MRNLRRADFLWVFERWQPAWWRSGNPPRRRADPQDTDGDGISGRPNRVTSVRTGQPVLGRFGWKASQPPLEQQIAKAYAEDLGLTSPFYPESTCTPKQEACCAMTRAREPALPAELLEKTTLYIRLLAVPAGQALFQQTGCATCHHPEFRTGEVADIPELSGQTIRPYTDLLLHDMGKELADGRPDAEAHPAASSRGQGHPRDGGADSDSVNRAFAAGAYDYLEKNAYFEAILKVKVRHALEAARERRMAALANGKREETIRELWHGVRTERAPSIKGALLEDLVALLFKSIPGFERTQTNRKSLDEEIDIVIPNESTDPFWLQAHSQYILGECKNWSKPVERKELDVFLKKIERRYGRCRLGFFISIGGFARGFESGLAAERAGEVLVVALDAARLDELVRARDRNAKLKELHARALMASAKDSE